ncbi:MAG: phosphopentomutase [Leptospira sp.]|nr:phosphopentomutase [Leptospira sp.]
MKQVLWIVLDSFGLGEAPDAEKFGDTGADTFGHIAQVCADGNSDERRTPGSLNLPNLTRFGLYEAAKLGTGKYAPGYNSDYIKQGYVGSYGIAAEKSFGKDTPSGHWEMAGVPVLFDWGYFSNREKSFPDELLDELQKRTQVPGFLGNCHSSGTEIIKKLGEEHMKSGRPIVYTSADSVFQVACHEESFGLDKLMEFCQIAREVLMPYNIGRVIARPFIGTGPEDFKRTGNRRDLAVEPPAPTVLDLLSEKGIDVISVGKIADIFAHKGITHKHKATGLAALVDKTIELAVSPGKDRVIFTNLVDFDMEYGHRRDPIGYASALEYFDSRLPDIMNSMGDEDLLIMTADHGCDPTWPGSDHTREYVPVLAYGKKLNPKNLGIRSSFADMGRTIEDFFGESKLEYGESFLDLMKSA